MNRQLLINQFHNQAKTQLRKQLWEKLCNRFMKHLDNFHIRFRMEVGSQLYNQLKQRRSNKFK